MKYTEEMILQSESGYCMPFEERKGKDVKLSLGYGEQTDPTTGKTYFHHGIFNGVAPRGGRSPGLSCQV